MVRVLKGHGVKTRYVEVKGKGMKTLALTLSALNLVETRSMPNLTHTLGVNA
jgi:hypothetical protein